MLAAFAAADTDGGEFLLAEFSSTDPFPAAMAIGFHVIDHLVHSWDVARTLGLDWAPDPELVAAAGPLVRDVPDGPERLEPGATFAPAGEVTPGLGPFDQLLVLLGREPRWEPTRGSR